MTENIPYEKWPLAYDDCHIEIRRDPFKPEEYGLLVKSNKDLILLPRGTLKDIAIHSRIYGQEIITKIIEDKKEYHPYRYNFLNIDSLIAAIDKAYIQEEIRRGNLV